MIKLWLDDMRDHPEGWERAYTVEDAIRILETGDVGFASLDHDLGASYNRGMGNFDSFKDPTGYQVVKWMAENNVWPPLGVRIHTDYAEGRKNMMNLVEQYAPYKKKFVEGWGNVIYTAGT